ncbi:oxidoreductase-like protein [Massarina eburnea CBS 473.64]|uniref:Oxidoreductase-like protein n=1 Tax=Massarina eburnea CBS 473.64 TaxID=1395130 RepID=A0A6A6RNI1_9PLEO|nr:oxidoreductase-like protein [Massarina eburnea CBS 473.64]
MTTRRAVVVASEDGTTEVKEVPLPKLRDDYIIVRTKAVALNPTDWKSLAGGATPGAISGCDYAGIVEQVGKAVPDLQPGDRVAGFARGADSQNHDNGSFATVITAKSGIYAKLTSDISFEDAATLGVGISTVGQGLYQTLGLPLPPNKVSKPTSILIYGGSTATGTLAVQFAKLSGLTVYATASPHNFDLVKSLGADEVFNYKDADVGAKIRAASNDSLAYVWDTISEGPSPGISAAALSSKGGQYATILPVKNFPRDDVKPAFTLAYTSLGEEFHGLGGVWKASKEDYDYGVKFWKVAQELINQGKIRTHPTEVRSGGLEAIPQGLQDLKDGKVSGKKLVYKIE